MTKVIKTKAPGIGCAIPRYFYALAERVHGTIGHTFVPLLGVLPVLPDL